MFMEVASEGGIPGFMIFMFILWTVWKTLTRVERLSPDEHPLAVQLGRQAFWLKITFLAFCACGLFLSTGLTNTFVTFVALPLAFGRIVQSEVREFASEREAADGKSEQEAVAEHLPKPLRPMQPARGLRGSA
jgi:hypothetical protein